MVINTFDLSIQEAASDRSLGVWAQVDPNGGFQASQGYLGSLSLKKNDLGDMRLTLVV